MGTPNHSSDIDHSSDYDLKSLQPSSDEFGGAAVASNVSGTKDESPENVSVCDICVETCVSRSSPPDKNDAVAYEDDDNFGLFSLGRDYEPVYVTHRYTPEEWETLAGFESLDYLPSQSVVYKQWLKRQSVSRLGLDRWLMMGIIGFVVGLVGFFLHQLIEQISGFKWQSTQDMLQNGDSAFAWLFAVCYSEAFIVFSACVVIFWRPSAGGSGIPEVTGYLNGTHIKYIFCLKTMAAKFLSCMAAIGCGMPVGPEGPMIHLGALVGAGVSQGRSETFNFEVSFFERFRNSEDRRNFVSAGAAAGVASAFGAPIGGLLFSMEEVSSFWTTMLSWQIFFCCMVSSFTTDLFNSAFHGFRYIGDFGQFKTHRYILFNVEEGVDVNILMFLPTVLIGIVGGGLGALFTFINLKIARFRLYILSRMEAKWKKNTFHLLEPVIIMVIVTTLSVFLPAAFPCSRYACITGNSPGYRENCFNDSTNVYRTDYGVTRDYKCPEGQVWHEQSTWYTNSTYNELASLLFGTTESAVERLFTRNSHRLFGYRSLAVSFCFYFVFVCWSCGTSIASGILVPMLLIGSLYGRTIGLVMVSMFGIHTSENSYWKWMDPGAFALIGAASFMGGVTRLTLTVTVMMMELTNDVQVLLPVMVAVMVGKWVGDFFTHPIFHAHLELKCIPFLEPEPRVTVRGKNVRLEQYSVTVVMSSPVDTIHEEESVRHLAAMLLRCRHEGFPVVRRMPSGRRVFVGTITRMELIALLMKEELFARKIEMSCGEENEENLMEYGELESSVHGLSEKLFVAERNVACLVRYILDGNYENVFINLKSYMNQSALSISMRFSLHRAYVVFRTLGLRHLVIVSGHNEVVGIVTRKDLMGFSMVEKFSALSDGDESS